VTVAVSIALRPPRSLRSAALPAALLAAWASSARLGLVDPTALPPPDAVVETAEALLRGGELWGAVAASLSRTLAGFGVAVAVGVPLGLLLGVSRRAEQLAGPSFHAWRQVAVFAWIPLISAWVGGGDPCKIAFVAVAAISPVIFNTFVGVRSLAPELRELARVLEIGRARFLLHVVLPAATPQLFVGLQLALVTSWLATIGAELFLEVSPGVGAILVEGRSLGRMELVIAGILVAGAIGFTLTSVLRRVERRVLRWRPAHPHSES
jgi:sulfonate transport system permease protein